MTHDENHPSWSFFSQTPHRACVMVEHLVTHPPRKKSTVGSHWDERVTVTIGECFNLIMEGIEGINIAQKPWYFDPSNNL